MYPQQSELVGSFTKVVVKYKAQKDEELSVDKGDTVQILDTAPHNLYLVRKDSATEGWVPHFVIGQRDHEESSSRY